MEIPGDPTLRRDADKGHDDAGMATGAGARIGSASMKRMTTAWVLSAAFGVVGCGRGEGPTLEGKSRGEWIADLSDSDDGVRKRALQVFAAAPAEAGPALPKLVACLGDKDKGVRHTALLTLEKVGAIAGPELAKALASDNERLKAPAAVLLVRIDPEHAGLTKILIRATRDESLDVRRAAGTALSKVGAVGIDELIDSAKSKDVGERGTAVTALGSIGPRAAKALPVLESIAKSDTEDLRRYASAAVSSIRRK